MRCDSRAQPQVRKFNVVAEDGRTAFRLRLPAAAVVAVFAGGLLASAPTVAQAPDATDEAAPSPDASASAEAKDPKAKTDAANPGAANPDDGDGFGTAPAEDLGVPPVRGAPLLPPDDELKALAEADPRYARRILRRAARTGPRPRQRAFALRVLGVRDPSRATARICARALRIDSSAGVRRSAAECLGRMPERVGAEHTPTLVAALDDDNLDVVSMVGWALASVGDAESLGEVTRLVDHEDERVGRHFFTYANRLRTRHGLNFVASDADDPMADGELRLVPAPGKTVSQVSGLELTASTAWVGMYGGMAGWLHGGLFSAAYGQGGLEYMSPLFAMGGLVAGLAAGGSYGFFRADRLHLAQNVVQLGTAGTIAGYGAGLLSGLPPASGVNAAGLSLLGTAIGTGFGVILNETAPPTGGALAMGLAVGFGAALSSGAVAAGYNLIPQSGFGLSMFAGGSMALLTTALLGPYEFGLLPSVGATVGGISGALVSTLFISIIEAAQLQNELAPFTEGAGWGVAAGYAIGAVAGASTALFIPDEYDPLKFGSLKLDMPTISAVPDVRNPGKPMAIARLGGRF